MAPDYPCGDRRVRVLVDDVPWEIDAGGVESLLRALRRAGVDHLPGGCEQGECGSCTVLLDGRPVCSCLLLAAACDGAAVTTVRGAVDDELADALVRHAAVQCGFCTPGFVVAMRAVVDAGVPLGRDELREQLAGNLCRCTGYEGLLDALGEVLARRTGAAAP